MNLSFAGCGFLGIYHIGVGVCLQKYAPHLLLHKISGASAGAIAACCLLCDLPIGVVASDMLNLIREARHRTLGPFSPCCNVQEYLSNNLNKVLPDDAHLKVNGKLHISLTRISDGKNVLVSQFDSKDDLLQALLASAFVPVFSGFFPPMFHGERYIDGGFSDNLPTLDENTITVSPFCGETDICPRDFSSQLFHVNFANTSIELSKQNVYRFARILWPPRVEILSKLCKQGFDDALRFLQRNNLINCTHCVAVQSTFVLSEAVSENSEYDPQCLDCELHRQEASRANLPDTIVGVFQDAIDSANKGFYNWMLSHRGMKLMTLLSLPYAIPLDLAMATLKKVITLLPSMSESLRLIYQFCSSVIMYMVHRTSQNHYDPSNITCQMEYTGLGYDDDMSQLYEKGLNFKLHIDESELKMATDLTTNEILARRDSLPDELENSSVKETLKDIFRVTSHQDAIVKFSYMDDDNKVKITEIYDVTESSTCSDGTDSEDKIETIIEDAQLWDGTQIFNLKLPLKDSELEGKDITLTDAAEYAKMFSEPESEWMSREKVEDLFLDQYLNDLRPESDQSLLE